MEMMKSMDLAAIEARVVGLMFAGMKMTSREIAELTGKRHADVMRDIRVLISDKAIGQSNFAQTLYKDIQNQQMYPEYVLDFKATLTLTTGYDAGRRAAVIDRWMYLEEERVRAKTPKPVDPMTQLANAVLLSQQIIAEKDAKIALDAPKVAFVEEVWGQLHSKASPTTTVTPS